MFITDIPQFDISATLCASIETVDLARSLTHKPDAVYTICAQPNHDFIEDDYSIYGTSKNNQRTFEDYDSLKTMDISNILFDGSRALTSKEVDLLNRAFSKSQSVFPTKL
jgi:hypothetical protein